MGSVPIQHIRWRLITTHTRSARAHEAALKRKGTITGICEYVMSGHKLRIAIRKESLVIAFSPSGAALGGKQPAKQPVQCASAGVK